MADGLSLWLVHQSGIPCRTACGIRFFTGTVLDNLLRHFCLQRTDASSAFHGDKLYKSLFTYLQPPLGKSSVFCVTVSPVTRSAGILACTQLKMLPVNGASHSANLHHRLAQLGQTSPAQSTAKGMSCLTTDLSCICKNLLPQPLQKDFIDKQHSITLLQFSVASVNLVIMVSKHCGQSFTSGGRLPNTQQ